jgi:hypothetical protein
MRRLIFFLTALPLLLFVILGHELVPHEHGVAEAQGTTHDRVRWHPPEEHEHGDEPPAWVGPVGFDEHGGFHGNTSAFENTEKHNSMKGTAATFTSKTGQTQDTYVRTHFASNVGERGSRYHSYEFWLKDPTGAITHTQGWANTGDPIPPPYSTATGRTTRMEGDPGRRPHVLVVDYDSWVANRQCEQWYTTTSRQGWGPDIGSTICGASTLWFPFEQFYTDYIFPTGQLGLDRELELSFYRADSLVAPNRGNPPLDTEFHATQFGDAVSGPNDPVCQGTTERFGQVYPNKCLPQIIRSTALTIENLPSVPNANRSRKVYPGAGTVRLPN